MIEVGLSWLSYVGPTAERTTTVARWKGSEADALYAAIRVAAAFYVSPQRFPLLRRIASSAWSLVSRVGRLPDPPRSVERPPGILGRDLFFPVGNGETLAREIPGARLPVLEQAATAIPVTTADEIAAAMLAL